MLACLRVFYSLGTRMDGEQEHLSGYQARDWEYVDYEMYQDEETGLWFRGPRPVLEGGNYFTCVGAAQTFGCFCPEPYPELLFGSPDTLSRRIDEVASRVPINEMFLIIPQGLHERDDILRSLDLFANRVMPNFT